MPTRPITPRDMSEPRCGVARKTTRLTNGSGLKKRYVRSSSSTSCGPMISFERPVRVEPPELIAAVDGHHVAEQATHAVPQQDHPIEGRVAAVRVVHLLGLDRGTRAGSPRRSGLARRSDTCRGRTGICCWISGLRWSSLSIGIQARGVEINPWTMTTGIFPGSYGRISIRFARSRAFSGRSKPDHR